MEYPITIGFFSVGIEGAFDPNIARMNFQAAIKKMNTLSKKMGFKLVAADEPVTNRKALLPFLNRCAAEGVDLMVLHTSSFTSGEIGQQTASFLIQHIVPIIVWGVPEPEGGSLPVNNFCCTNFMTSILASMGVPFKWLFVAPNDRKFVEGLAQTVRVVDAIRRLRQSVFGLIGSSRVPGFFGSNFDETALKTRYGVSVTRLDLSTLYQAMGAVPREEAAKVAESVTARCASCDATQAEMEKTMQAYIALRRIAEENGFSGMAMRCWPELRADTGVDLCLPMALLGDDGIPCACEGDIPGLLSMMLQFWFTGAEKPPTLLDMVAMDDMRNTVALWHCGVSSLSLMQNSGCCVRHHSIVEENSQTAPKGLTAEGTIDPGPATMFRIQGTDGGHYFAVEGEVVKAKSPYRGSHADFRPANLWVMDLANTVLSQGITHHYSLAMTYHLNEIEEFCYWLGVQGIGIVPYNDGQGSFGML